MLENVNALRKMEAQAYYDWLELVAYVQECRNAVALAGRQNTADRKNDLALAKANAEEAFDAWTQLCDALDELELHNHREPRRP